MTAGKLPPRAEPVRYVRAWCCYRLLMALPMRWAWCRKLAIAVAPHAGDWAYRYAEDGGAAPRSREGEGSQRWTRISD